MKAVTIESLHVAAPATESTATGAAYAYEIWEADLARRVKDGHGMDGRFRRVVSRGQIRRVAGAGEEPKADRNMW